MAKDGGTRNANSFERFMEDVGLGFRCPDRATWAIAVTKTGPVKDDDPVSLGRSFDKAARLKSWIIPELPCNRTNGSPSPCSM